MGSSAASILRGMAALLAVLLAQATALAGPSCSDVAPCEVADGTYFVRPPANWDGHSPLPAVVFLHGYSGSAEGVMADEGFGRTLSDAGILLVAPQGLERAGQQRSWSFPGKALPGRDDIAFIGSVVDDVARRYPLDRTRLVASGFSVGGSMVWYLACHGGPFAAYAPVAGAFWKPEPTDCPGGPQSLRHVHGEADRTVPMTGRSIRTPTGTITQGDVLNGMATWRRIDGCSDKPDAVSRTDSMACSTWSGRTCRSGRELVLCLHTGEHVVDAAWIVDAIRWAGGLDTKKADGRP